jgi:hypothetical protein
VVPAVLTPDGGTPDSKPGSPPSKGLPGFTPESPLTISTAAITDPQKKHKFLSKRMKGGIVTKDMMSATKVTVLMKDANPTFLQTYIEQNKLPGLGVLQASATSVPDTKKPSVLKEAGYPPRAEQPKEVPAQSPVAPEPPPIEEPQFPTFTPRQREELINFINNPTVKLATDKYGELVDSPHGLDQMEEKAESMSKQFGGLVSLRDIIKWPEGNFQMYSQHDGKSLAKIAFILATEVNKLNKMLDLETTPAQEKEQEVVEQPTLPIEEPAPVKKSAFKVPSRKVA